MAYTIKLSEDQKFWQVFEDGIVRTTFNTQEQATEWCDLNSMEYTVE
jgi:hypothetical protein